MAAGEVRVTQSFAEVIYPITVSTQGEVRVTQNFAEIIYTTTVPTSVPAGRRQVIVVTSY